MDKGALQKQTANIFKEGYLEKQSRFFKSWRQRWVVVTTNFLLTFKERRIYQSPTETILLKDIVSIKSTEEELQKSFTFKVQTNQDTFYFCASTAAEKQTWIGSIGKAMVKSNHANYDD